jgi:hypothetical protein
VPVVIVYDDRMSRVVVQWQHGRATCCPSSVVKPNPEQCQKEHDDPECQAEEELGGEVHRHCYLDLLVCAVTERSKAKDKS